MLVRCSSSKITDLIKVQGLVDKDVTGLPLNLCDLSVLNEDLLEPVHQWFLFQESHCWRCTPTNWFLSVRPLDQRNPIKGLPLEREWSKALPCPSREMKTNGTAPTVLNREPARCRYCCWLWPVYERKEEKAQESWATTPSRHLEKETIKRRRLASIILEVGTDGDILLTENLDYLYPLMAVDPFSEDFLDVNSLVDEA